MRQVFCPKGSRVYRACKIVEQLGCATTKDVNDLMPDVDRTDSDKYLRRGVSKQLLNVDRTVRPKVYTIAPGWHALLLRESMPKEPKRPPAPKPPPVYVPNIPMGANYSHHLHTIWHNVSKIAHL